MEAIEQTDAAETSWFLSKLWEPKKNSLKINLETTFKMHVLVFTSSVIFFYKITVNLVHLFLPFFF